MIGHKLARADGLGGWQVGRKARCICSDLLHQTGLKHQIKPRRDARGQPFDRSVEDKSLKGGLKQWRRRVSMPGRKPAPRRLLHGPGPKHAHRIGQINPGTRRIVQFPAQCLDTLLGKPRLSFSKHILGHVRDLGQPVQKGRKVKASSADNDRRTVVQDRGNVAQPCAS